MNRVSILMEPRGRSAALQIKRNLFFFSPSLFQPLLLVSCRGAWHPFNSSLLSRIDSKKTRRGSLLRETRGNDFPARFLRSGFSPAELVPSHCPRRRAKRVPAISCSKAASEMKMLLLSSPPSLSLSLSLCPPTPVSLAAAGCVSELFGRGRRLETRKKPKVDSSGFEKHADRVARLPAEKTLPRRLAGLVKRRFFVGSFSPSAESKLCLQFRSAS